MSMHFTSSTDHLQNDRRLSPRNLIENRTPSCMIITFLSVLSLSLLIAVIVLAARPRAVAVEYVEKEKFVQVCRGGECERFVSDLNNIMDTSYDPCENFYEYTCGNWSKVYPINPNEISASSPVHLMQESVFKTLSDLLKLVPSVDKNNPNDIASFIFKSCIENFQDDRKGDLIKLIDSFGGWPLSGAPSGIITFEEILKDNIFALTEYNLKIVFDIGVFKDPFKPNSFTLIIGQSSGQGISYALPEIYNNPFGLHYASGNAMQQAIRTIVCSLYANCPSISKLDEDTLNLLLLEQRLMGVKLQTKSEFLRRLKSGSGYSAEDESKITLDQLQQGAPLPSGVTWVDVMQQVLNGTVVDGNFKVVGEIANIKQTLDILGSQDVRVVKNWFIWKVLMNLAPRFSKLFRETFTLPSKDDDYCAGQVNSLMPYATANIFDTYHWKSNEGEKIKKVTEMVSELKQIIGKTFTNSQWISQEDKTLLVKKLELMKVHVAFPSWIKDPAKLAEYYKPNIDVSTASYLALSRELLRLSWERDAKRLNEQYDESQYWFEPDMLQVNAWYYALDNSITIPMGILSYPIFPTESQPRSVIYGLLGSLVGHEIYHGFYVQSLQLDGNGQYVDFQNVFSQQFLTRYEKSIECLVLQYDDASGKGLQTISEDFPDNAAAQMLYEAFSSSTSKLFHDDYLPDLALTKEQLFYVSFASFFCQALSPKYQELIADDVHSLNQFRVQIPLGNTKSFSDVFKCRSGSKMNPQSKCEIF